MPALPADIQSLCQRYRRLRGQLDEQIARLTQMHQRHLACRAGCCQCCIHLSVWPVEFVAIAEDLAAAGIRPALDEAADCPFLKDGLCQIYPFRPIICRTHGLPLAYLNDQDDWQVWFCQNNFVDADDAQFDQDSVLNMEQINQQLAELQAEFVRLGGAAGINPAERVKLGRIIDWLAR